MFWTSSKSTDTQKVQERFERKLYVRPKDRKTLLAFGNFLYEQKQYAYAAHIFDQSVAAGNDGRQLHLRMARTRLALYRQKLDEDAHHQGLEDKLKPDGYEHMSPEEGRGRLRRALAEFSLCLEYPQTLHQPATLFEMATAYYRVNDYQQSCTLLAHHFQMFPASPLTPFVTYLSAHILMFAENWRRASEYYQQLTLEPVPLTMASQQAPPGDDNNDAVPLIDPPPHAHGVMMECGRCHERISMVAAGNSPSSCSSSSSSSSGLDAAPSLASASSAILKTRKGASVLAESIRKGVVAPATAILQSDERQFHATLAAGLYKETFEGLIRKNPRNCVGAHYFYETWVGDPETWAGLAVDYCRQRHWPMVIEFAAAAMERLPPTSKILEDQEELRRIGVADGNPFFVPRPTPEGRVRAQCLFLQAKAYDEMECFEEAMHSISAAFDMDPANGHISSFIMTRVDHLLHEVEANLSDDSADEDEEEDEEGVNDNYAAEKGNRESEVNKQSGGGGITSHDVVSLDDEKDSADATKAVSFRLPPSQRPETREGEEIKDAERGELSTRAKSQRRKKKGPGKVHLHLHGQRKKREQEGVAARRRAALQQLKQMQARIKRMRVQVRATQRTLLLVKRLMDKVKRKRAERFAKRQKWCARSIQKAWRNKKAWDGEAGWRLLMESKGKLQSGSDLLEKIRPKHRERVRLQLVAWERCAVRMQTRARMVVARRTHRKRVAMLHLVGSYFLGNLARLRLRRIFAAVSRIANAQGSMVVSSRSSNATVGDTACDGRVMRLDDSVSSSSLEEGSAGNSVGGVGRAMAEEEGLVFDANERARLTAALNLHPRTAAKLFGLQSVRIGLHVSAVATVASDGFDDKNGRAHRQDKSRQRQSVRRRRVPGEISDEDPEFTRLLNSGRRGFGSPDPQETSVGVVAQTTGNEEEKEDQSLGMDDTDAAEALLAAADKEVHGMGVVGADGLLRRQYGSTAVAMAIGRRLVAQHHAAERRRRRRELEAQKAAARAVRRTARRRAQGLEPGGNQFGRSRGTPSLGMSSRGGVEVTVSLVREQREAYAAADYLRVDALQRRIDAAAAAVGGVLNDEAVGGDSSVGTGEGADEGAVGGGLDGSTSGENEDDSNDLSQRLVRLDREDDPEEDDAFLFALGSSTGGTGNAGSALLSLGKQRHLPMPAGDLVSPVKRRIDPPDGSPLQRIPANMDALVALATTSSGAGREATFAASAISSAWVPLPCAPVEELVHLWSSSRNIVVASPLFNASDVRRLMVALRGERPVHYPPHLSHLYLHYLDSLHLHCRGLSVHGLIELLEFLLYPLHKADYQHQRNVVARAEQFPPTLQSLAVRKNDGNELTSLPGGGEGANGLGDLSTVLPQNDDVSLESLRMALPSSSTADGNSSVSHIHAGQKAGNPFSENDFGGAPRSDVSAGSSKFGVVPSEGGGVVHARDRSQASDPFLAATAFDTATGQPKRKGSAVWVARGNGAMLRRIAHPKFEFSGVPLDRLPAPAAVVAPVQPLQRPTFGAAKTPALRAALAARAASRAPRPGLGVETTPQAVRAYNLQTLSLAGMPLHADAIRTIGRALMQPECSLRALLFDGCVPYGDVSSLPRGLSEHQRSMREEKGKDDASVGSVRSTQSRASSVASASGSQIVGEQSREKAKSKTWPSSVNSKSTAAVVLPLLPFLQRSRCLQTLSLRNMEPPLRDEDIREPLSTSIYCNSSIARVFLDGNDLTIECAAALIKSAVDRRKRCVIQDISLQNQRTRIETVEIYALAESASSTMGRWRVEFEDADVFRPSEDPVEIERQRHFKGNEFVEANQRRYDEAKESGRRTLVVPHFHGKGNTPVGKDMGDNSQYGRTPLPCEVDARMLDWDDDLAFSRAASDAFRNNQTKVHF